MIGKGSKVDQNEARMRKEMHGSQKVSQAGPLLVVNSTKLTITRLALSTIDPTSPPGNPAAINPTTGAARCVPKKVVKTSAEALEVWVRIRRRWSGGGGDDSGAEEGVTLGPGSRPTGSGGVVELIVVRPRR